jgi:hypothetical protein
MHGKGTKKELEMQEKRNKIWFFTHFIVSLHAKACEPANA